MELSSTLFSQLRYFNLFAATILCTFVYSIGLVIYRLFLSPLSKFPGPKIAAATHYYEFYHNYWRQGQYIYRIEEMHKKYGMCLLIDYILIF